MATRQEAIDTLERGHAEIRRLTKQIPPHWMARPGVGGGEWTPKDVLGHLCFWEEKVLEALVPVGLGAAGGTRPSWLAAHRVDRRAPRTRSQAAWSPAIAARATSLRSRISRITRSSRSAIDGTVATAGPYTPRPS